MSNPSEREPLELDPLARLSYVHDKLLARHISRDTALAVELAELHAEFAHMRDDRDGKGFLRDAAEAKVRRLEEQLETTQALCRELYDVFYPHLDESERVRLRASVYGEAS